MTTGGQIPIEKHYHSLLSARSICNEYKKFFLQLDTVKEGMTRQGAPMFGRFPLEFHLMGFVMNRANFWYFSL